jgi:hypothetical protein
MKKVQCAVAYCTLQVQVKHGVIENLPLLFKSNANLLYALIR